MVHIIHNITLMNNRAGNNFEYCGYYCGRGLKLKRGRVAKDRPLCCQL
jgi:hypothetical protein